MSETDRKEEEVQRPSDPGASPAAMEEGEGVEGEGAEGGVQLDEVDVRDLLRAALQPPPPKKADKRDDAILLKGVQKRIRMRSKGKFYADGWSTSRSPRSTYLVTSIFILDLIGFVFFVLIPWSNSALP